MLKILKCQHLKSILDIFSIVNVLNLFHYFMKNKIPSLITMAEVCNLMEWHMACRLELGRAWCGAIAEDHTHVLSAPLSTSSCNQVKTSFFRYTVHFILELEYRNTWPDIARKLYNLFFNQLT